MRGGDKAVGPMSSPGSRGLVGSENLIRKNSFFTENSIHTHDEKAGEREGGEARRRSRICAESELPHRRGERRASPTGREEGATAAPAFTTGYARCWPPRPSICTRRNSPATPPPDPEEEEVRHSSRPAAQRCQVPAVPYYCATELPCPPLLRRQLRRCCTGEHQAPPLLRRCPACSAGCRSTRHAADLALLHLCCSTRPPWKEKRRAASERERRERGRRKRGSRGKRGRGKSGEKKENFIFFLTPREVEAW